MKLERPIVFFDIETTGLSLSEDRIIEIAMIKKFPDDNDTISYCRRINPEGREITPEAFGKHGIKSEDLELCPIFKELAEEIRDFIKGCDLGGYNCKRFDIPILIEEFLRAGIPISVKEFNIIDVFKILAKAEPRTLEATYKRFIGKSLEGAHNAEADITATMEILDELETFFELPDSVKELDKYAFEEDASVDLENKLKRKDNNIIFNFGKYKDKTIEEVYKMDPNYYDWIIKHSDMTMYTKAIFRNILKYLNTKK
jgi:DNA polymerase III subunit epsilon